MGFLNDDPSQSEALNEQIRTQKEELEAKKESLYQTRLDIIKGQGGQIWEPRAGGGNIPRKAPVLGIAGK